MNKAYTIIRLLADGLVPAKYRNAVWRWLISARDTEAKDEALQRLWAETRVEGQEASDEELTLFHERQQAFLQPAHQRKVLRTWLRYAAVIMLPLVVGVAVWQYAGTYYATSELVECMVADGKTDSLLLSDGTKVHLNAGTLFYYERKFNPHTGPRHVYLSGEAHFEVAKDEKKPFIVHVGNLNITVLGTTFNVKAYSDEPFITTTLKEGLVKVSDSVTTVFLHPNEQAVYERANGKMRCHFVDVGDYDGWLEGEINFDAVPLHKILTDIGRKYGVIFNVDSAVDLTRVYSTNFKGDENIEDVMKVLSRIGIGFNYTINHKNNVIRLYQSRKEALQ